MLLRGARITYLIYGVVLVMVAGVFWLAQERHILLGNIEDDFTRLQSVARTGRVAAEVGSRLAGLSAAMREYIVSEAIEPPVRIGADSSALLAAIGDAQQDVPSGRDETSRMADEAGRYLASFEAVVAARRQRQERLVRLSHAAGTLRVLAEERRVEPQLMRLREAELAYIAARGAIDADRVAARLADLAREMPHSRARESLAEYKIAFARVVEIFDVHDRGTVRILEEHDARLRGLAAALVKRAQTGEGVAASGFRETLEQAILRNMEVFAIFVVVAVGGAFALLRFVILPLNRMSSSMTALAAGDYAQVVPYVDRGDEIGQMARSLQTFRNALLSLAAAQTQAETASRHKSDFIANMSHELRTPLNGIIGLSEMLLEDVDNPDPRELKDSLPRITVAAKHLLGLINDILDLSRIEAGRMTVEITRFAPANLAEESLATVAPIARQKGLRIAAAYPAQLPEIDSDPQRVRQILINLLGNAVKFTDAGEVRIEVAATSEGVRYRVTDTGPGIAAEDLGRLFQDFAQLDASPTRKFGGSGLGLALSRRMAHLIGGDVTLESEVGRGSTFILDLPLVALGAGSARGAGIPVGVAGGAARTEDGGAG